MAYKQGNRHQMDLFPKSIEEYVQEDDPVRVYDAFVESLSMEEIDIEINCNCNKVGNSQYDPEAMLKLLIYGYSIASFSKTSQIKAKKRPVFACAWWAYSTLVFLVDILFFLTKLLLLFFFIGEWE